MDLSYRWREFWLLGVVCGPIGACGDVPGTGDTITGESSGTSSGGTTTPDTPTTVGPTTSPPPTTTSATDGTVTTPTGATDTSATESSATEPGTSDTATVTSVTTVSTVTGETETSDSDSDSDTDTDGTTGPVQMFTPLALEVEDFDADGNQDLLVLGVDNFDGTVARLSRGVGDGTFMAAIDPGLTGASAFPVVGELDDTPGVDVMMAQEDNVVAVFRWTGAKFEPWKSFANTTLPRTHVIADGDGDGDDDIVWLWWDANAVEFGVSVRPNGGGFFFAPVDTKVGVIAEIGLAPQSLMVGDIDGDGDGDALVWEADKAKGFLRMFGSQQGLFGAAKFVAQGVRPWVAALGDFDEDGKLDIVTVERSPAKLVIALGDGKGAFAAGGGIDILAPFKPFTIAVADVDGDQHLDVAIVDDQTPEVRIFPGNGDAGFLAPKSVGLDSPAVRVHARALDAQLPLDLAVATFAAGDVTIVLNP